MSTIEANINIQASEDVDTRQLIQQLKDSLTVINGKNTRVNVIEMDNPINAQVI